MKTINPQKAAAKAQSLRDKIEALEGELRECRKQLVVSEKYSYLVDETKNSMFNNRQAEKYHSRVPHLFGIESRRKAKKNKIK